MNTFVVAIDGPAGSGKSTAARKLAEKENFAYLNTGAMYRAVALLADEGGIDLHDADKVVEVARNLDFEYRPTSNGEVRFYVKGRDRTDELFTSVLTQKLKPVVNNEQVREELVAQMRKAVRRVVSQDSSRPNAVRGVVMEGRDIGTVVFPDADVKFYLSAGLEERARRREAELRERGELVDLEGLKKQIKMRDEFDAARSVGPLKKAADAVEIDTTDLDPEATLERMCAELRAKILAGEEEGADG